MEKPELIDYGLSEQDLARYESQRHQYREKMVMAIEQKKENYKKIRLVLTIGSILLGIILAIVNSESDAWFVYLICPFGFTIIPLLILYQNEDSPQLSGEKLEELRAVIDSELEVKCEKYYIKKREYENYIEKCQRDFWITMDGYQFEKAVASLFRTNGYKATVTPAVADGGVDIILEKDSERIAVQCKHHAKPVGPNDVRALQGVVASQDYLKGIFVSLNGFTPTVHQEVRSGNVQIELLELKDILQMAKEDRKPSIKKPSENRNLSYQPAPFKQSKSAQESQISKSREFNRKITVQLGDEVKIRYLEDGEVMTIKLVPCDPDFSKHEYSVESPVGKAIFGRKIHDIAEIYINDKIIRVEILELA